MYQISQKGIDAINKARPGIIRLLMIAIDCSENSINRHIRDNIANGDLTKKAALEVIQNGTGLSEGQILVKLKSPAMA